MVGDKDFQARHTSNNAPADGFLTVLKPNLNVGVHEPAR
jgi:hypothetical protein